MSERPVRGDDDDVFYMKGIFHHHRGKKSACEKHNH
jgi:hypothetical protein